MGNRLFFPGKDYSTMPVSRGEQSAEQGLVQAVHVSNHTFAALLIQAPYTVILVVFLVLARLAVLGFRYTVQTYLACSGQANLNPDDKVFWFAIAVFVCCGLFAVGKKLLFHMELVAFREQRWKQLRELHIKEIESDYNRKFPPI